MRLKLTPGFCAMLCFLAWLDWKVCLLFIVSAAVHEAAHLLAMALWRVPVYGVRLTCAGARIQTGLLTDPQEALIALAGPLANGLLAATVLHRCPGLAIVSLVLGMVNLLPIYPLDGGRILLCVLRRCLEPDRAEQAAVFINFVTCSLVMVGACWISIGRHAGLWPIFAALILLWRAGNQEKLLQFLRREDKMEKPE